MAKRTTKTEVVIKALARSGPELTPSQIRLDDSVQTDASKVFTQSDVNQSMGSGGGGGGGGGGIAPDLDGYAKTEYVDEGDAALDEKIAAVAKDLDVVENDYTTTAEFNTLNSKVTQNKKDIASLGEAFDTAVLAAQDGAEALEIELQSYVKKEDLPEGADLSEYAKTEYVDSADAALNDLIAANTKAIEDLPTGGGAVGINEVLAEGNIADAAQSLKFQVSEADVPYDAPSTKDTIDLDGRFASRYGAIATIHQVNEPFTIDTDYWDGVYQRAKGHIAAYEVGFEGQYQSGGGKDYFVWANYGMSGAFLSITPQEGDIEDEVTLNINTRGLEFTSRNLKIREGSVTATEFIGDGSKLTNLPHTGGGQSLPGQKWNLVMPHALPPSPGEMMWVDGDNALYCHATTADGNVLGNATTDFSIYNVNGTVILSAYKQGVGIEAIFKAATVEMITTSGQTYWKFIKTDHGRFNLIEGQSYNVTASGMF